MAGDEAGGVVEEELFAGVGGGGGEPVEFVPGLAGARAFDAGDVFEGEDEVFVLMVVGNPEFREILDEPFREDGAAVETLRAGAGGHPFNRCRCFVPERGLGFRFPGGFGGHGYRGGS